MKEVAREPRRSQKRESAGDEAEDERPDRYQAVQEDKDIVMEEVKSFNKVAFEMNQMVRDERMNRLLTNNPNTDECWNINAKKLMADAVRYVEKWKPQKSSSGTKLVESDASRDSIGTGASSNMTGTS